MSENNGLSRSFKIDRKKVDPNKRTVELAFSSETPVDRWGENEVLSHNRGDYDFSRFSGGDHPLLLGHDEHNPDSQIGVIQSARVDGDKVGRAVVRFGNSAKANEIFQDVQDGIRQLVSVGYDRTSVIKSEKAKDGKVTTRYKWEPTHIAIVPVPADTAVGIGRSKKRMCGNCDGTGECPECDGAADDDAEEDDRCSECSGNARCRDCGGTGYMVTAKGNLVEVQNNVYKQNKKMKNDTLTEMVTIERMQSEIHPHLAEQFRALTSEAQLTNMTLVDYRGKALEMIRANPKTHSFSGGIESSQIGTPIGMSQRQVQDYSISRALRSYVEKGRVEGPEKEYSDQVEKQCGERAAGFFIPCDVAINPFSVPGQRRFSQRDMTAEIFNTGGALVNNQMMTTIELLRNRVICARLGARPLAGCQGNVLFPREDAPATAYAVPEIGALTPSQMNLGQISLSPKRIGAQTVYSKQLVFQSTPDAEALIRDDLLQVIAISHDSMLINGSGSNSQPMGILNTPGIGSMTFGGVPTYAEVLLFETLIGKQNADLGALAYATTPGTKGIFKGTAVALTGATTVSSRSLWQDGSFSDGSNDGIINGYRAASSNQIPNDQVIFGNWNDLIYATWNGFDIVVDYVTKAGQAEIVLTINTWMDSALRHPQSFVASSDAGSV